MNDKKIIGYIEATVSMPVYEGEEEGIKNIGDFFQFSQPTFHESSIATVTRDCKLHSKRFVSTYDRIADASNID